MACVGIGLFNHSVEHLCIAGLAESQWPTQNTTSCSYVKNNRGMTKHTWYFVLCRLGEVHHATPHMHEAHSSSLFNFPLPTLCRAWKYQTKSISGKYHMVVLPSVASASDHLNYVSQSPILSCSFWSPQSGPKLRLLDERRTLNYHHGHLSEH